MKRLSVPLVLGAALLVLGARPIPATPFDKALLDCARLTYLSQEQPLEVTVYVAPGGAATGLVVPAGSSLICPADKPLSALVLGSGNGRSWGNDKGAGLRVTAFCQPALGGEPGTCWTNVGWTSPVHAEAPERDIPVASKAASTYRADARGVTLTPKPTSRDPDLQAAHAMFLFCLHARQPAFEGKAEARFRVWEAPDVNVRVVDVAPAALRGVQECLVNMLAGGERMGAVEATIEYEVTRRSGFDSRTLAPYWGTTMSEERLEAAVGSEARKPYYRALESSLQTCLAEHPPEARHGVIAFSGPVDSRSSDIRVGPVEVDSPAPFLPVATCAAARLPRSKPGAPVPGRWYVRFWWQLPPR